MGSPFATKLFEKLPLGVTWNHLTVKAVPPPPPGPKFKQRRAQKGLDLGPKTLIEDSHGCVKPGEMLLVVGRPGAGCSTLLNVLANNRQPYTSIGGHVFYGSLSHGEAESFRAHIVLDNGDEEPLYPTLTVEDTIKFATSVKTPPSLQSKKAKKEYTDRKTQFILDALSIDHVKRTKVGSDLVRGVSGGERRRVAIAEVLATCPAVMCFDSSTRGLDATSALDFVKTVKNLTKQNKLATIMVLHQASDHMYNLFDKVLVLEQGKQMFYGKAKDAEKFMTNLGFVRQKGRNMTDFIINPTKPEDSANQMSTADPEDPSPYSSIVMDGYRDSKIIEEMRREYDYPLSTQAISRTQNFIKSAAGVKVSQDDTRKSKRHNPNKLFGPMSSYLNRQMQILRGDVKTILTRLAVTLVASLLAGSLFLNAPDNTSGMFVRGGSLNLSLLYNCMIWLSEVSGSITIRPILARQKSFGAFHPASYFLTQMISNICIMIPQITLSSVVIYFMTDLTRTPQAYFTYYFIIFSAALCMATMFQAIGSYAKTASQGTKNAGLIVMAFIVYVGYIIPRDKMHPWLGWLQWINPLAYAFEALMGNEFENKTYPCVGVHLIPQGSSYDGDGSQGCAGIGGSVPGQTFIEGEKYLNSLWLSSSHIWRNVGIIYAGVVFFLILAIFFATGWALPEPNKPPFKPAKPAPKKKKARKNLLGGRRGNKQDNDGKRRTIIDPMHNRVSKRLSMFQRTNHSVFSWTGLSYTINAADGERMLLDNVSGWVEPGQMLAVMGASGSGKSTLLDVLAQRKSNGILTGSMLIGGYSASAASRKSIGYCQQSDMLEPFITVREALEFSARLRQPFNVSEKAKLKQVENVLDLLELRGIENMRIGEVNCGLTRVQHKMISIAIELAAKPETVLLLDEPTSGLDSQDALSLVTLLRKVADSGYAILVTIHQPTAQTFAEFDTLLLLGSGGKTAYFGTIGPDADCVRDYFEVQGGVFESSPNPAECIISNISGREGPVSREQWLLMWAASSNYMDVEYTLNQMVRDHAIAHFHQQDLSNAKRPTYATPLWYQAKVVCRRYGKMLLRDADRIKGSIFLHLMSGLFNGFSFWKIGDSVSDMQLRLFTIFLFVLITPAILNQEQHVFIRLRDLYEQRERGCKSHSSSIFILAHLLSSAPLRCICAIAYFVAWYFTVGFSPEPSHAGRTLLVMIFMQFVCMGLAQLIAVNAPNPRFATVLNPAILGMMVLFCGALVPYSLIPDVWRDSIYYIDPFNYLIGSLLVINNYKTHIKCGSSEFAIFNPPTNSTTGQNETCSSYLAEYLQTPLGKMANLTNPNATTACEVCPYEVGSDYLEPLNLTSFSDGWTHAAIVAAFAVGLLGLVFILMGIRSRKATQTLTRKAPPKFRKFMKRTMHKTSGWKWRGGRHSEKPGDMVEMPFDTFAMEAALIPDPFAGDSPEPSMVSDMSKTRHDPYEPSLISDLPRARVAP